jgi:hypothetical protein
MREGALQSLEARRRGGYPLHSAADVFSKTMLTDIVENSIL